MDLIERRALLNRKGSDNVKEWTKILDFTFDETEKMPSDIDISEYTEFFVSLENVTNKSNNQSNLNLNFGQVIVKMTTQKKDTVSMGQQAYFRNNGLFLEQYVMPFCVNNSDAFYYQNSNIMAPYMRRTNPVLSPLTFSINSYDNTYAIITGTIVIYAR